MSLSLAWHLHSDSCILQEAQQPPATLRTKPLDPVLRPPLPSKKRPAPGASKLIKDHRRVTPLLSCQHVLLPQAA